MGLLQKKPVVADYSFQPEIEGEVYAHLTAEPSGGGVVLAATPGAGKTNMAIRIADRWLREHSQSKVLVLTHGQRLLQKQFHDRVVKTGFAHTFSMLTPGIEAAGAERLHVSLPHYFQDRSQRSIPGYELIIIDEAHHFFTAPMVEKILDACPRAKVLALTGSPSCFIASQRFPLVMRSAEDLIPFGVLTDPYVELVQTSLRFGDGDYNDEEDLKEGVEFTESETASALGDGLSGLFSAVVKHLRSPMRAPQLKAGVFGKAARLFVERHLGKTLIVCHTIAQAEKVHTYLEKAGFGALISTSKNEYSDSPSIEKFKAGPETFLVVVNKATLGFDYPELMNIVDISFRSPDKIFQALCRVVRPSEVTPEAKKLYIMVTPTSRAELTHHIMSFVMALSTSKVYKTYDGNWKHIPTPKSGPVKPRPHRPVGDGKGTKSLPAIVLPRFYTFEELRHIDNGVFQPYAWSNFTETRKQLSAEVARVAENKIKLLAAIRELKSEGKTLTVKMVSDRAGLLCSCWGSYTNPGSYSYSQAFYYQVLAIASELKKGTVTRFKTQSEAETAFSTLGWRLEGAFTRVAARVPATCPNGHRTTTTWATLKGGSGCNMCMPNRKKTQSEAIKLFARKGVTLIGIYQGASSPVVVKFSCGHQGKTSWTKVSQGRSCGRCSRFKAANTKALAKIQAGAYAGVVCDKRKRKRRSSRPFSFSLQTNERNYRGTFPTAIEAAKARDKIAFAAYGDKLVLNFPEDYGLPPHGAL